MCDQKTRIVVKPIGDFRSILCLSGGYDQEGNQQYQMSFSDHNSNQILFYSNINNKVKLLRKTGMRRPVLRFFFRNIWLATSRHSFASRCGCCISGYNSTMTGFWLDYCRVVGAGKSHHFYKQKFTFASYNRKSRRSSIHETNL